MSSAAKYFQGHWMSAEALGRLPALRREFDQNRDPALASQIRDQEKTEAERREESAARGYRIPRTEVPAPALRPPPHMRGRADREGALAAERDRIFALAKAQEQAQRQEREQEQEQTITHISPSL